MFKCFNYVVIIGFLSINIHAANEKNPSIVQKLQEIKDMIDKGSFTDTEKRESLSLIKEINKTLLFKNPTLEFSLPVPEQINIKQESNTFSISPTAKGVEHAVYIHQIDNFKIPANKRIDFIDLYKEIFTKDIEKDIEIDEEINLTENQRFMIMAEVEKRFIDLIRSYPDLSITQYVGESGRDLLERFNEHNKEIKKNKTKKSKIYNNILDHSGLKMTHIIVNLPNNELKNFEVLIGNILPVNLFFANTVLGNKESWKVYNSYKDSNERNEKITQKDYLFLEEIKKNITNSILGSVEAKKAVKRKIFTDTEIFKLPEAKKTKTE